MRPFRPQALSRAADTGIVAGCSSPGGRAVWRGCVGVWTKVAAALLCAAASGIVAAAPRDADLFIRPEDQRTVLFGSLDAGRSVFLSGGSKQSLTGPLDRSGFLAMETSGFGLTRERSRSADVPVLRLTHQASVMAGYQWALDGLYLAAFVGPELHQEQLAYGGRVYRFSEPRLGARGQFDLWSHPTRETLLTATLISGSTRSSLWGRASAGIRVFDKMFVGPEVTVYTTPTYGEIRYGAHLTGLSLSIVTFRVSAGWMSDDTRRRGSPYVGLGAWMRL